MNDSKTLQSGAIALINVFTAKPDQLNAFCEVQIAEYKRLKGQVDGELGNRLYKRAAGSKAVNVAYFESRESMRLGGTVISSKSTSRVLRPS